MNKALLTAILLTALTGCYSHPQVTIFPGAEAEVTRLCAPNGGIKSVEAQNLNINYYKSTRIKEYHTRYMIVCNNGARIDRDFSRPGEE